MKNLTQFQKLNKFILKPKRTKSNGTVHCLHIWKTITWLNLYQRLSHLIQFSNNFPQEHEELQGHILIYKCIYQYFPNQPVFSISSWQERVFFFRATEIKQYFCKNNLKKKHPKDEKNILWVNWFRVH